MLHTEYTRLYMRKIIYILILVSIIPLLFSCSNVNQYEPLDIKYDYEERWIGFREPKGNLIYNEQGYFYSSSNDYFFSNDIEKKYRDMFINYQTALEKYLVDNNYIEKKSIVFYLLSDFSMSLSLNNNNTIYLNYTDAFSNEQIKATLQLYYGQYSHYGSLYGTSVYIANRLNWNVEIPLSSEFTITNEDLYEMNALSFSEKYMSSSEISTVKNLSYAFAEYQIKKDKAQFIQFMKNSNDPLIFENEFKLLLNAWITSEGKDYCIEYNDIGILFSYYGSHIPISIKTKNAIYYINENYEDFLTEGIGIDYINDSYSKLIFAIDKIEKDMDLMKNLLSIHKIETVEIHLLNKSKMPYYIGRYTDQDKKIEVASIFPIVHEYIHFLTYNNEIINTWQFESLASYFESYSFFTRLVYYQIYQNLRINNSEIHRLIETYLNRSYEETDILLFADASIYVRGNFRPGNDNHYFDIECSIASYIVDMYGDISLLEIYSNPNQIEAVLQLTWEELLLDWENHLHSKFD